PNHERTPEAAVRTPPSPRTRRLALAAFATVMIGPILVALFYSALFRHNSPKRLTINSALVAATVAPPHGPYLGHWVAPTGSVAGYRIGQQIAGHSHSTAVGRTSGVTGTLDLVRENGRLVARSADIKVDLTKLESNNTVRDRMLHTLGLQTNKWPTASFV